jgi:succinate-acetate transporter protein
VLRHSTARVAYVLLGIWMLGSGHPTITKIGGWVTVACAVVAWYASAAIVINGTLKRTILPVVPLAQPP